jgi:hypothetical protein
MRTDAQIASLLLGFTLPIRRYDWFIGPTRSRAGHAVPIHKISDSPADPRTTRPSALWLRAPWRGPRCKRRRLRVARPATVAGNNPVSPVHDEQTAFSD